MKKLMKKKVNVFGKKLPVFLIALFAIAIVSAALLPYFGQITGNATVNQGLSVDAHAWNAPVVDTLGPIYSNVGGFSLSSHYLQNDANEASEVTLVRTDCSRVGGWPHSCDEITTSYYELETLEDTQNQEKFWCSLPCLDLITLDGQQLDVSVSYEDDFVVFKATPPSSYNLETSGTTFTFDTDSDGLADFQIQYMGNSEGWKYDEVVGGAWEKAWSEVPSGFDTDLTDREFTLKVPMSTLGGLGSNYKFGVQANGEPSHQIFYSTEPRHLWWDGSDYVHSTYYVEMTLGTDLTQPITVPAESTVSFFVVHEFPLGTYPGEYSITTEVSLEGY